MAHKDSSTRMGFPDLSALAGKVKMICQCGHEGTAFTLAWHESRGIAAPHRSEFPLVSGIDRRLARKGAVS